MEWSNGGNGRMAEWRNGGMAEWWPNGRMVEQPECQNSGRNGGRKGGIAGMAGMVGMAEWQKEWQNGRMAEMATYVLFMVHATNDDDDTLIF